MRKNNRKSATTFAWALATTLLLAIAVSQSAQAQTYNVIHYFTGQRDGGNPLAGLTIDTAGNLYGTAAKGGAGYGTAYKLTHKNGGWVLNPLYSFKGNGANDGAGPDNAPMVFGPDGTLYGTTFAGGGSENSECFPNFLGYPGCGTVFNLRPPATVCKTALCDWDETVLYSFTGATDGQEPDGPLVFDGPGSIYGTASGGGMGSCFGVGCGVVYELTPSNNLWLQTVLYSFRGNNGGPDGGVPHGGVVFDRSGNLYGTTYVGGNEIQGGTVYQLAHNGSGWMENQLYVFQRGSDGGNPTAGVILDTPGNVYGATITAGPGSGTAFELTNGSWAFTLLYGFAGNAECGPYESLVMDAAGNLYGTTVCDGIYGYGSVFKLSPPYGQENYTSLHDFCADPPTCSDGAYPVSTVVFDSAGNLYGTAYAGGSGTCNLNGTAGCGVVWEITPN